MTSWMKATVATLFVAGIGYFGIHLGVFPGSAKSAQEKLENKAAAALVSGGHDWARVTFEGQKAVLNGEAPSESDQAAAVSAVKQAVWNGGVLMGGVTAVEVSSAAPLDASAVLAIADNFTWGADYKDGSLALYGNAPSEAAAEAVRNAATRSFEDAPVESAMTVSGGGPEEGAWVVAATTSLHALSRLEAGSINAAGTDFRLEGTASDAARMTVLENVMAAMPAGFTSATALETTETETSIAETETAVSDNASTLSASTQEAQDTCNARLLSVVKNETVNFSTASTAIGATSRPFLNDLADALQDCPRFAIEISGHTDSRGSEERNLTLSQARADAVATYLIRRGASEAQLSTIGLGSSLPAVSNRTIFGRAQNRRIEFVVRYDATLQAQIQNNGD